MSTCISDIKIVEVGPRDGLQNEKTAIPTAVKLHFIEKLAKTGLQHIEATSFVHPKAVPQLADALLIVRGLPRQYPDVQYSALVPNMRGLERALESGIRDIAVFTAASDTFNQRNIRMSVDESLEIFQPVVKRALAEGLFVRGYVSTAFYCPYQGKISRETTRQVSQKLLDMGIAELSIGDTIGQAVPADIEHTVSYLLESIPVAQTAMHFHDTNGRALDNVQTALDLGIRIFDASAGGLGGCPYAPGASGNLATERLVRLLHQQGYRTGVNLDALQQASGIIFQALNRPFNCHVG